MRPLEEMPETRTRPRSMQALGGGLDRGAQQAQPGAPVVTLGILPWRAPAAVEQLLFQPTLRPFGRAKSR